MSGQPVPVAGRAAAAADAAVEMVDEGGDSRRPRGRSSAIHGSRLTPYLFLAPFLTLFTVFVLFPGVLGIWISLHNWDFLLPNKPFVGAENYLNLFDSSSVQFESFWNSMRATAIFVVISVPFLVVLPLLLAMLLHRRFPGRTFFRAVFFAPFVLGVAVIGLMWSYLLDPSFGLVNGLLGAHRPPGRHGVDDLAAVRVDLAGRGHHLVDDGFQRGDLPRRPRRHPGRPL